MLGSGGFVLPAQAAGRAAKDDCVSVLTSSTKNRLACEPPPW